MKPGTVGAGDAVHGPGASAGEEMAGVGGMPVPGGIERQAESVGRVQHPVQHRHDPIAVRDRECSARTKVPLHVDHEDGGHGVVRRNGPLGLPDHR